MSTTQKEIPTLFSIPREEMPKGNRVFCKYCKTFHLHGIGEGHRVAHCTNDESPYNKTGYYIKRIDVSANTLELINSMIETIDELRERNFDLELDHKYSIGS